MEVAKIVNDNIPESYQGMLSIISDKLPVLQKAKENFCKTQSQFMDNSLTLHQPTPIRLLHQILANCEKIESALQETYFKREKQKVELEVRQARIQHLESVKIKSTSAQKVKEINLNLKMLDIEVREINQHLFNSERYINASIRQFTAYIEQYELICKKHNIENLTEADYEAQEEEYHIKTAFTQAINASRSKISQRIDEGNFIYFQQLGISGYEAQKDIDNLLLEETKIQEGHYNLFLKFLDDVAKKYKGRSSTLMQNKGLQVISKLALLEK
jgi:hypothetical protein